MQNSHCCHETSNTKITINKKLKITGTIFIALFVISFLPGLENLNQSYIEYLSIIWWAVILGLFIGGVIDHFVPDGFIFSYLGKKKKRTLFYAVIAGFLLSACSHGILAIAIQLYKKGASIPAVITFLLASPWANFPITILLFSFFGWKALLFVLSAMLIALITGFIFTILEEKSLLEPPMNVITNESYEWTAITQFDFRTSLRSVTRGTVSLANMVLWWILIGFIISVLIKTYAPHSFFMDYFGPDFLGLCMTLLVATVIEICSEGSSPIAFEIYNQVGSLGNPFVFLMAGVVTDYTEIGLLWSNIGKRTAIYLPIIAVPQVLFIAYLFNQFL